MIETGKKIERNSQKLEILIDTLAKFKYKNKKETISPTIYLFTFNKDLLKSNRGCINYKVYYPLISMPKEDWPLEYQEAESKYFIDYSALKINRLGQYVIVNAFLTNR